MDELSTKGKDKDLVSTVVRCYPLLDNIMWNWYWIAGQYTLKQRNGRTNEWSRTNAPTHEWKNERGTKERANKIQTNDLSLALFCYYPDMQTLLHARKLWCNEICYDSVMDTGCHPIGTNVGISTRNQGWRSSSSLVSYLWVLGFDSQTRYQMWVEFVRSFPWLNSRVFSGFPSSANPNMLNSTSICELAMP